MAHRAICRTSFRSSSMAILEWSTSARQQEVWNGSSNGSGARAERVVQPPDLGQQLSRTPGSSRRVPRAGARP